MTLSLNVFCHLSWLTISSLKDGLRAKELKLLSRSKILVNRSIIHGMASWLTYNSHSGYLIIGGFNLGNFLHDLSTFSTEKKSSVEILKWDFGFCFVFVFQSTRETYCFTYFSFVTKLFWKSRTIQI